jgi:segregation and condensation protein A
MTRPNLSIRLAQSEVTFESLVAQILEHRYDPVDLPLAEITRQFSRYLEHAGAPDLEISSEFIEGAACLIYLKSQSILSPYQSPAPPSDADDPLSEERLRALIDLLREQFSQVGRHPDRDLAEFRLALELESSPVNTAPPSLQDVLAKIGEALAVAQAHHQLPLAEPDPSTVEDRIAWVLEKLVAAKPGDVVPTSAWFDEQPTGQARSALVLALLELAQKGRFDILQKRLFTPIFLRISPQNELNTNCHAPLASQASFTGLRAPGS